MDQQNPEPFDDSAFRPRPSFTDETDSSLGTKAEATFRGKREMDSGEFSPSVQEERLTAQQKSRLRVFIQSVRMVPQDSDSVFCLGPLPRLTADIDDLRERFQPERFWFFEDATVEDHLGQVFCRVSQKNTYYIKPNVVIPPHNQKRGCFFLCSL